MALLTELLPVSTGILLGVVLMSLLVVYLLSSDSQQEWKEPPGPKPLPILGNLLELDLKRPYLSLLSMSKQYGSVFTVYFGLKKVVVLAGYQTVKQALVNHPEEFGDRDISPIFYDLNEGYDYQVQGFCSTTGILFSNGENWKEMRRFALSTLRDIGMGKRGVEEKIAEETRYLRELFEQFKGNPFDATQPVNYAVSNIIVAIVYGSRFEYSDSLLKDMVNRANESSKLIGSASIQKTLSPQHCRGLVDCFLERKQNAEKCGDKNTLFHENNLLFTVTNLFAAGADTTGTTLRWGLLLMAKYPHVQDRVQEEIDNVAGDRQIVMEDKKNLPYTEAVIHEIQRVANILPMSLPHTTACDVHFQRYFIKKGTCVFPLLTSVLRDENEWESPNTFNPEHFLDEQGRFVKRDAFMPFSAGRRLCLGESLARMELFLFFTSLLQHFHFSPPPGMSEDQLDLTPAVGLILNPSPHKLCAISRSA
ncbi:cytochrome P450 2K1-like isoform X3 [Pygocentrus nattereri]|uniref:cytochrome P450 2K1-like isoform X3 n=1 Tax=Pygocentrus nattereri TaxID=42514 RepID=UPI0008143232|nr:cytochrome P450 2K1-like isoform X3 [Pygocentrus nattereri]